MDVAAECGKLQSCAQGKASSVLLLDAGQWVLVLMSTAAGACQLHARMLVVHISALSLCIDSACALIGYP